MAKILFIGLGVMGAPMAGHLLKAGHDLTAYNRTGSKALQWLENNPNAKIATDLKLKQNQSLEKHLFSHSNLKEAIINSDIIISCIGKDNDLHQLAFGGEGILANAKPNTLWIDHTTASANIAKDIHLKLLVKKIHFIDAPVSGGEAGAINGKLTIMMGADQLRLKEATDIMQAYALKITHVGPCGSGQITKMVNQICLAGVLQGLSEGLNFAKKSGVEPQKIIEAISKGAAQSWQMDNRSQTMLDDEFDFGFAIDLMRKDLNICFEHASSINASLPMTHYIDEQYKKLQAKNHNNQDTSVLIKQFK